jgi:hypothetical protein
MVKKIDFTKEGDPIIKINDILVSFDKSEIDSSENFLPLVKSIEAENAEFIYEYKTFSLDLSKQTDRELLEDILSDVANGWWANIIYFDCKYNNTEGKWQAFLILSRSYAKISQGHHLKEDINWDSKNNETN